MMYCALTCKIFFHKSLLVAEVTDNYNLHKNAVRFVRRTELN